MSLLRKLEYKFVLGETYNLKKSKAKVTNSIGYQVEIMAVHLDQSSIEPYYTIKLDSGETIQVLESDLEGV